MVSVRQERTGWRDLRLSDRHRKWGWDCPGIDLDFIFIEYNYGKVLAIVEYKYETAPPQALNHPSYLAIVDLGTRASVPVIECRYSHDFTRWSIVALNDIARPLCDGVGIMTERQWVALLYEIRCQVLPEDIF